MSIKASLPDRKRAINNDLILHLHPRQVPAAALRFTYTFGLGGLAVLLLVILIATGMLLAFAYTPSSEEAYRSIVTLETQVYFGHLIRSLHHWSANFLLVVTFLHLLRVFYTRAFRPPRGFNWQIGLALMGLVILANFTGYLLPWDQRSYWAVTVAGSLIAHVPLIGEDIRRIFLGGDEVTGSTLTNFFALHIIILPLGFLAFGAFHIWRVRKDKISVPHNGTYLPTIPHLVNRELIFALVMIALLLTWATWVKVPLEGAADPNNPPNPTKTAWYFMGIQELLLHFHPTFGAVIIPALVIGALMILPYLPGDDASTGMRVRWLAAMSFLLGSIATIGLIIADKYWEDSSPSFLPASISHGLIPLGIVGLGIWGYHKLLRKFTLTRGEMQMAIFTLLMAAFITLTVIGIVFRGENMALSL